MSEGRIRTKEVTRDIKTIDRPGMLASRVRRTAERGIGEAGREAYSAYSDDGGASSPETGAVGKFSNTAGAAVKDILRAPFDSRARMVKVSTGEAQKAGGAAKKTAPPSGAGHSLHRVRSYTVKGRDTMRNKALSHEPGAGRVLIQGRRLAQVKAAKKAVASVRNIKKAWTASVRSLRAIIAAMRGLITLIVAGGWVVLIILIVIVLIAALLSSPIGIFFSNDPGAGGMTTREAVMTLGDEFSEYILGIEESNLHDELVVVYTGGASQIDWKGVLAIYVVKVNQNGSDSIDVVSFDDEKLDILRGVMWDMNVVFYELIHETRERTVTKPGEDGMPVEETETVTITTLKITITQKSTEEMAVAYSFTDIQRKALGELLSPELATLWDDLLGGFVAGGGMREPSKDRIPIGPFTWPLETAGAITSFFGWREDPFTGETAYHSGVDIGVSEGTPILAAADGTVIVANGLDTYGGGYGYYINIRHAGDYETLYAHCSAVAARAGESVKRGQIIGYVGNTGRSKGNHLHWEVYLNGSPNDPLAFFI